MAQCLYNTSMRRTRVRPFRESNAVFDHNEADEILSLYGNRSGNPLAYLFGNPLEHYAVCTVR